MEVFPLFVLIIYKKMQILLIFLIKALTLHFILKDDIYMKKIVLLSMLLVSASTFMMAQTPIEQAREKAKALIKGGVTDISKILPKHESDDEEDLDDDDDDDSTIDPLEGKSEEYIRGFNDARRKTYEEQKASFAKAGIDFNQTALSKLRMDSVGIYANIDNSLVAMKHVDADENRVTMNDFASKWLLDYDGKTSPYQFPKTAQFRVYFTHERNSISEYYKMFSSDLTIDDFIVCRFKVKGNKREFIGARNTSAFLYDGHTKSKAEAAKDVTVSVKKISDNIFDMTVKGEPGEYCLTWNEKEAASWTVFDFTIK